MICRSWLILGLSQDGDQLMRKKRLMMMNVMGMIIIRMVCCVCFLIVKVMLVKKSRVGSVKVRVGIRQVDRWKGLWILVQFFDGQNLKKRVVVVMWVVSSMMQVLKILRNLFQMYLVGCKVVLLRIFKIFCFLFWMIFMFDVIEMKKVQKRKVMMVKICVMEN